jgi:hypothetical protein
MRLITFSWRLECKSCEVLRPAPEVSYPVNGFSLIAGADSCGHGVSQVDHPGSFCGFLSCGFLDRSPGMSSNMYS